MLQWMSTSDTARQIDSELGKLQNDKICLEPLLTYQRYDVELTQKGVQDLDPGIVDLEKIRSLKEMDTPENMKTLHRLGELAAARAIKDQHFPDHFDLQHGDVPPERKRYRKKADQFVIAVQLELNSDGFDYQKWGATQHCKPGDWLVNNHGDTYSVDKQVFARTYRELEPGRFVKTTPVWAQRTTAAGSIKTKEGESHYHAGDYLVVNDDEGTDIYCVSSEKFESMYEADEGGAE